MRTRADGKNRFYVEVIKPSHYDDDGYVIQWTRGLIPSNSLACLLALSEDAARRRVLGDDVEIVVTGYDECHTVIPTRRIIKRIQRAGGRGLVMFVGVQSNQFPRTADLAGPFREAGIPVVIGGFHVSGCLAMLPELPPELAAIQKTGVSLFAGEAEGRLDRLFTDAHHGEMQPVYNYLSDLPDLEGQVTPFLPAPLARRTFYSTAFDTGRGCPFQCSFCTVINVQGRKSRHRTADDVEQLVRAYLPHGINRFFITDDNMARNKNWESIFDRLIQMREKEGIELKILVQVDTMSHKIPRFIEKAARAGCNRVFIGLESVNPENLAAVGKSQNRIGEYREMLLQWRSHGVTTYAGYILGFPADTPESIERDIKLIKKELPIDIMEFFTMTPLPGSADHKAMVEQGQWMDGDLNAYDVEHVTMKHPLMSAQQWRDAYERAWHDYYDPQHVETLMRRAKATNSGISRLLTALVVQYGGYRFERLHPFQCGVLRRKVRTARRPGFPKEHPLLFYPRRAWEIVSTSLSLGLYYLKLERMRRRIERDPNAAGYTDRALKAAAGGGDEADPADIEQAA